MRNMYMKFPEVMLVVDGYGLSEIIGLFLVEEESKEVI